MFPAYSTQRNLPTHVQLSPTHACSSPHVGEAYDKVARLLSLDLRPSGGAALELIASEGDENAVRLPVPMQREPNCDFSYAGLKTSVKMAVEQRLGSAPATDANRQASSLVQISGLSYRSDFQC